MFYIVYHVRDYRTHEEYCEVVWDDGMKTLHNFHAKEGRLSCEKP